MQLRRVPPSVAHAGLRAIKAVCRADQPLSPLECRFIAGVQTYILHTDFDLTELPAILPAELAHEVPQPEFRQRIIAGAVVAACIDGEVSRASADTIEEFAAALDLDPKPVQTAKHLANHHFLLARLDIARRALAGHKVQQTIREEGLLAMVKQMMPLLGWPDLQLQARYQALANYAKDTLGRAYFEFVTDNHLSFPGEKGAGPEIIVVHDCLHVLGGYGTTPEQEIEASSFQAGCHTGEPLYGLLFGLAQYHLGIQVAPIATAEKMHADPERMLKAFARGCQVKRDMWRDFQPWDHFARPLQLLREELGILPP